MPRQVHHIMSPLGFGLEMSDQNIQGKNDFQNSSSLEEEARVPGLGRARGGADWRGWCCCWRARSTEAETAPGPHRQGLKEK